MMQLPAEVAPSLYQLFRMVLLADQILVKLRLTSYRSVLSEDPSQVLQKQSSSSDLQLPRRLVGKAHSLLTFAKQMDRENAQTLAMIFKALAAIRSAGAHALLLYPPSRLATITAELAPDFGFRSAQILDPLIQHADPSLPVLIVTRYGRREKRTALKSLGFSEQNIVELA